MGSYDLTDSPKEDWAEMVYFMWPTVLRNLRERGQAEPFVKPALEDHKKDSRGFAVAPNKLHVDRQMTVNISIKLKK